MSDLLERLEKATGPDRELDVLISAKFDGYEVREEQHPEFGRQLVGTRGVEKNCWLDHPARNVPALTSSIDAALALAERVFGHACAIGLYTDIGGAAHSASVHLVEQDEPEMAESYRTLALALCLAIIKAHEATHDR